MILTLSFDRRVGSVYRCPSVALVTVRHYYAGRLITLKVRIDWRKQHTLLVAWLVVKNRLDNEVKRQTN